MIWSTLAPRRTAQDRQVLRWGIGCWGRDADFAPVNLPPRVETESSHADKSLDDRSADPRSLPD
jgi:hypothetical protein